MEIWGKLSVSQINLMILKFGLLLIIWGPNIKANIVLGFILLSAGYLLDVFLEYKL